MKILNLYACLGGNRYKWDEVANEAGIEIEVTAIEWDEELARLYQERFPNDTVAPLIAEQDIGALVQMVKIQHAQI